MKETDLMPDKISRRRELARQARSLITKTMEVYSADEESLMTTYRGFYLQISFSEIHPLLVLCLASALSDDASGVLIKVNEMNLSGVFGSFSVNEEANCYTYRAVLWLDTDLTLERWLEILDRCTDEAVRGFVLLSQ